MRKYSKDVYSKEVLLKAAFSFTNKLYIHLDADENYFLVELGAKNGETDESVYCAFENELIAQENRLIIAEKTRNIRELIVARALSSTMINTGITDTDEEEYNADDILQDWFKDE